MPEGRSVSLVRGILDSKRRRATWERNNEPPPMAEPESIHKPLPGPDGTQCLYGRLYSPAALAMCLRGERPATSCGEVTVTGLDDPWLAEQDARLKAQRRDTPADDEAARIRAEQVALYYEEQARPRRVARKVAGTSDWMTED
jgi:hypothetical protein